MALHRTIRRLHENVCRLHFQKTAYLPDLSPMDFYWWSTLKSLVYFNFVPQNLAELQNKITEAIKDIDQDELR